MVRASRPVRQGPIHLKDKHLEAHGMKECLIDVLNVRNTVLHVFAIPLEDADGNPRSVNPQQEALRLAARLQLVLEKDAEGLHARPHVSRGGALQPFGDALETKHRVERLMERHVRELTYFVPQKQRHPESEFEGRWLRAPEIAADYLPALSYRVSAKQDYPNLGLR